MAPRRAKAEANAVSALTCAPGQLGEAHSARDAQRARAALDAA